MPSLALLPVLQGSAELASNGVHESPVISLVGAFLALMVIAELVNGIAKRFNFPFTVALVVVGAVISSLSRRFEVLAPLGELQVTPEAVFFVFLPTLIFQSAFHLDARSLRENLAPTLTLAVPGLLVSTALIGAVMHTAAPWVGTSLSWPAAFLLGSILSATDPVAVIALFSQLGAPKRLVVLVEGESLFNDATAIVLSRIILGVMSVGVVSTEVLASGTFEFVSVFFGGLLVGGGLAFFAGAAIGRVHGDAFIEITTTTVLAYLSFFVAEHYLGMSGVMAVVAAGVTIGGWGKSKISPSIADYLEQFWDYLAGVANALIFLLVGLTVNVGALVDALPILTWVVFAMLVSRALVIYSLVPVVGKLPGSEPIDRSYQTVMYWGCLRGGIALAIALSLPESVEEKQLFVTIATGAVLFTLIVQGLTVERVVRYFGLHVPPLSDRVARLEGLIAAKMRTLGEVPTLQSGGFVAPRVAKGLEARTQDSLRRLHSELEGLRTEDLDEAEEHRLLYLRCFGEEKTLYYRMFSRGHLSERSYRALIHSIELQAEGVRHQGHRPQFTLHPPSGERVEAVVHRAFERVPGLGRLTERLRASRAARDYEIAWARFHGDERVLEDLAELGETMAVRTKIVEELRASYEYWHHNARNCLDQIAESFPEFVAETQDQLAKRLALYAERDAVTEQARAGAIPPGVAQVMLDELDEELRPLSSSQASKLTADPAELLKKVPFFEGLPQEEFEQVANRLKPRTAPIGDQIVRQGEHGSSLFLIARGVVRVTRKDDGIERDVATLLVGDFFGEMAALTGEERTATCRAVTPRALYELSRGDVDVAIAHQPAMKAALEEAALRRGAELKSRRVRRDEPG